MDNYLVDQLVVAGRSVTVPNRDKLDYILNQNLIKINTRIRELVKPLPSNSLLLRLFNTLYFGTLDKHELWVTNSIRGKQTAKSLGFTTNSNIGKPFIDGVVLPPGTTEFIVLEHSKYPEYVEDWTVLKPIRILAHDYNDLVFDFLQERETRTGYGVISIDIPLLALQYQMYCDITPVEQRQPPKIWLIQYPLNNLIIDYANIAFYNRFHNLLLEKEFEPSNYSLSWVTLQPLDSLFESVSLSLERRLVNAGLSLGDYLVNLKLVDCTALDLLVSTSDWLILKPVRPISLLVDCTILDLLFSVWFDYGVVKYDAWLRGYQRALRGYRSTRSYEVYPMLTGTLESHHNLIHSI